MTKDKSETGANRALTDTARMRMPAFVDPLEQTQPMPVIDRRVRAHEAKVMRLREATQEALIETLGPSIGFAAVNGRFPDFRDGSRDWFTNVTRNGCRDES